MNPVPAAAARSTSIAVENKKILYISAKMSYDKESNCIYNLNMQHVDEKSKLTECSRERCPLWKEISGECAESIFTGNSRKLTPSGPNPVR